MYNRLVKPTYCAMFTASVKLHIKGKSFFFNYAYSKWDEAGMKQHRVLTKNSDPEELCTVSFQYYISCKRMKTATHTINS